MQLANARSWSCPARAFTLVEIMVVVVIIGLLASLALPAFQRSQRASQTARVVNDFRIFSQSFELYNAQNGAWPAAASAGAIPVGMSNEFRAVSWQANTAIGGSWNWDNTLASSGYAGIAITGFTCLPAQLIDIDAKLDDGDLTTGNFRQLTPNRIVLILAQ